MAPEFSYQDLLPIGEDKTEYRQLSAEGVSTFNAEGRQFLSVTPVAIENLTKVAIHDISHYLRATSQQVVYVQCAKTPAQ
jgi:fumarate hydratase class I